MTKVLRTLWRTLRAVSGDDAYDRYVEHHRARHGNAAPLDRRTFFRDAQRRKWSGVNRCC